MSMYKFNQTLQKARNVVDHTEPDPARTDWSGAANDLRTLVEALDACCDQVAGAIEQLDEPGDKRDVLRGLAETIADAVGLLAASGNRDGALGLVERGVALQGEHTDLDGELAAAADDLETFAALTHGRWLLEHKQTRAGERVLKPLAAAEHGGALAEAARAAINGPRPISGAPTLGTLNTFGISLFGRRDQRDDGTYIATTCLTGLFVPLVPLASYRVADAEGGGYYFLAKERLSGFARTVQMAVAAVVLLGVLGLTADAYLNSTGRKVARAVDAAAELEAAGDLDAANAAYGAVLDEFHGSATTSALEPVAAAMVRLAAANVPSPLTAGDVENARGVVLRYNQLPGDLRRAGLADDLRARLVAWADEVGTADLASRRANLRVLEFAVSIDGASEAVKSRLDDGRVALADALAGDRPLDALAGYAAVRDGAAVVEPMAGIFGKFPDGSSLWLEAGDEVTAWLQAAGSAHPARARISEQLAAATARDASDKRAALLESTDIDALATAVAADPHDHALAVTLAAARRSEGDIDSALALVKALGEPGWLTFDAQVMLGVLYTDAGDLEQASSVLAAAVASGLAPYQDAMLRYSEAATQAEHALINRINNGRLPRAVESRALAASSPDEQQRVLNDWIRDELANDATLAELSGEIARRSSVVHASLTLGRIRLLQANALQGDERQALLSEAEETFLAVRSSAEGQPEFHLGLGQVYYRLGKVEDGEKELATVLAYGEPRLSMAVVNVYRELGVYARAREVATAVFEGTDAGDPAVSEARTSAAISLSLLAENEDDEELWLSRADQSVPFVWRGLTSLRARKLLRAGDRAGADALFRKVAEEYAREARAGNGSAANNAAVAEGNRFACTGDIARLEAAVRHYERAYRLEPESAIVAGNMITALQSLAMARSLDKWFDVRILTPVGARGETLARLLVNGPERDELRARLTGDKAYRRALALAEQLPTLAPQNRSSYLPAVDVAQILDDRAGLEAALEVVERTTIQPDPSFEQYLSGARDEENRKSFAQSRESLERTLALARKRNDKRAEGVALHLLAQSQRPEVVMGDPAVAIAEEVRLNSEAARLFPHPGLRLSLAYSQVYQAIVAASEVSPEARAFFDEHRRGYPAALMMNGLFEVAPKAREVFRAHPGVAAALPAYEASLAVRPTLEHWVLARALGDADLERRAVAALADSTALVRARLDVRLLPENPAEVAHLELLEKALAAAE